MKPRREGYDFNDLMIEHGPDAVSAALGITTLDRPHTSPESPAPPPRARRRGNAQEPSRMEFEADAPPAPATTTTAGPERTLAWVERLQRDGKGKVRCNEHNVSMAILGGALGEVWWDSFTARAYWDGKRIGDAELRRAQILLQSIIIDGRHPFAMIGPTTARTALIGAAEARSRNSVAVWLNGLPAWDGTPRIEQFLADIFDTPENEYTLAVSRYFWLSMVRRIITPGERADMALVLVGPQGIGKTEALRVIAGEDGYVKTTFDRIGSPDWCQRLQGRIVAEIAEFAGHSRAEVERIKAEMTETHDTYRAPYGHAPMTYARGFIFVGTINPDGVGFLNDTTGNRRWLPVDCRTVNLDPLRGNREQYFAEARDTLASVGEFWHIPDAGDVQRRHEVQHPWEDVLRRRLRERIAPDGRRVAGDPRKAVTCTWLLGPMGLEIPTERAHAGVYRSLVPVMLRLGYARARWDDGRGYVLIDSEAHRRSAGQGPDGCVRMTGQMPTDD